MPTPSRKERIPWPTRFRAIAFVWAVACSAMACSTALGLSDFAFHTNESDGGGDAASERDGSTASDADERDAPTKTRADASAHDAAAEDASDDVTSCDADLATQCYPCAPSQPAQFLNACTSAACVPFDDSARDTRLLPDGALPPLPVNDAGAE